MRGHAIRRRDFITLLVGAIPESFLLRADEAIG
jgi:hypothetical protein